MTDRRKRLFNRVGGAQALPMHRLKNRKTPVTLRDPSLNTQLLSDTCLGKCGGIDQMLAVHRFESRPSRSRAKPPSLSLVPTS